jgi:hypothetical protein
MAVFKKETNLVNAVLIMIGQKFPNSVRAWRNNSGSLKDENGRLVSFGLAGSPDILGCVRSKVHPDVGMFFGFECKVGKNGLSPRQRAFREAIQKVFGLYFVIRDVEQAERIITAVAKECV